MKSPTFWDILMPCSPLEDNKRFGGTCRLHVPPKRRLNFNGLHGVISERFEPYGDHYVHV
jgi:hypothetical protein